MRNWTLGRVKFTGVSVDTRSLIAGNLFFALKGERVDGHHFIGEAAKKGAVAAVVQQDYHGLDYGLELLRVGDVLEALQKLAAEVVQSKKVRILAVTGSVGKTTTKTLLTQLLKARFEVAASPANYNSQIGLPLTILNHTTGGEDIWVLEMGMTEPGNIGKLVSIAPPDIAILTKIALVHAESVPSLSLIAKAKMEICAHPDTSVLICDHELKLSYPDLFQQVSNINVASFSTGCRDADYYVDEKGDKLVIDDEDLGQFSLIGSHHKHNLLAAIVSAKYCGVSWNEIKKAIPTLSLPERRMQVCQKQGITFVNDSYNAAPVSVIAALKNLPAPKNGGRRVAVLGEMMELGVFSEEGHRDVGECALKCVDEVFCYGKGCYPIIECWQKAGRTASLVEESCELEKALRQTLKEGDVVLLKGSCSKQLWKILDIFDD